MLTFKQERFCQNIVKGMTQYQSYLDAGYANNNDRAIVDSNASLVANSTKILARVNELKALVTKEYCIMPVGKRKEILSKIASATFGEFADEHGNVDITDKLKLNSPAIAEIRTERSLRGTRSTLKLRDPVQAIAELNKMDGDYAPEKHAVIGDIRISVVFKDKKELNAPEQS